jgi:hypothetical protein
LGKRGNRFLREPRLQESVGWAALFGALRRLDHDDVVIVASVPPQALAAPRAI